MPRSGYVVRLGCWLLVGMGWTFFSPVSRAQTFSLLGQAINAYAGQSGTASYAGDGGLATAATFSSPFGIAMDHAGNIYVADNNNNVVRKITQGGYISTFAGTGTAGGSGDGGAATSAKLNHPRGLAFDSSGNLYIADTSSCVIRKVTPAGIISLYAGSYVSNYSGDGGAATSATMSSPYGIAFDSNSNLYIADKSNNVIRKVTAGGTISTFAGNHTAGYSGDGGAATAAKLNGAKGVAVDASGNVYIGDGANNRVRMVNGSGIISTFAGTGSATDSGDGSAASVAGVVNPQTVMVDAAGNVLIGEGARLRWVSTGGVIQTIMGNGTSGSSGNGGAATSAMVGTITGVVLDAQGQLYVVDNSNSVVRSVALNTIFPATAVGQSSASQTLQIVINTASAIQSISVPAGFSDFSLGSISGCTVDGSTVNAAGTVCTLSATFSPQYAGLRTAALTIADGTGTKSTVGLRGIGNGAVFGFLPGIMSTFAGTGTSGHSGDGGAATSAKLSSPTAIAAASDGSIYISEYIGCYVRKVTAGGTISTVAGNGTCAFSGDGGAATSASLSYAEGIAFDPAGNLYIVDNGNDRIRKVDANGKISTVAGTGTAGSSGDGGLATAATFTNPNNIAFDGNGNAYIADGQANKIRILYPSGYIATFAGTGTSGSTGDGGLATLAKLNASHGVAVDSSGNVYIADSSNNKIRLVNSQGVISTVAGTGTASYGGDGGAATSATLNNPYALTLDAAGNMYVVDNQNNAVRMVNQAGVINTVAGTGTSGYSGDSGSASLAQLYLYDPGHTWLAAETPAVGNDGTLYIADLNNQRVRAVNGQQTATLSFASTPDDTVSAAQSVSILNQGNASLNFNTLSASAGYLLQANTCSLMTPLATGATCTVNVSFAPTSGTGTLTGTASVADSAPSSPHTISTTGTRSLQGASCSVSASPAPANYASSVTLTATISPQTSGVPSGTVTFLDGVTTLGTGTLNGSGIATLSSSSLSLGSHSLSVTYPGDTAFSSCTSSAFSESIGKTTPTITWATPSSIAYGTALSATQLNASSGGVAGSFVYTPALGAVLNVGTGQTLSVTFTPTDTADYNTATQTTSITVTQAASFLLLATSSTPANYGATVTFTATLPSAATGTVTFKDGSTTLGTGGISSASATFPTALLSVGSHSITAVWVGDTNYSGSTSSALSQAIAKSAVSITFAASPNPSIYGDALRLTFGFSGAGATPTGTATLSDGATTLATVNLDGSGNAAYTLQNPNAGSHNLKIVYNGDANYF